MPWETIVLNDGNKVPSIVFGTASLGTGQETVDKIEQAIAVGFKHLDTAQQYKNEEEAGIAIRKSGLLREKIYITTKYSGIGGLDIKTAFKESLRKLGVSYIDLYLIHSARVIRDIPSAWREFEDLKRKGLAKSIGVSNFSVPELKTLLASAKIKPAANQILLHPYVYDPQKHLIAFCQANGIVVQAYSALIPITQFPGGPVDKTVVNIAGRRCIAPEQVLLAWVKAKGVMPVTTSTKKDRLKRYLAAGDIELTESEICAIDDAGAAGV